MGFFKDMKNMRETAAEHGGMPNLGDARRDISKVFDDRGEREILKSGISAKAIVRGMMMPVQGDRFAMQVPLEIYPPQGESYQVQYVFPAVRLQAALSPGMEIPVKISKDDPQHVAVQWEAQKASIAASGGSLAAVQEGLAKTANPDASAMFTQAMQGQGAMGAWPGAPGMPQVPGTPQIVGAPAAPTADPEKRLEQLKHLKDSGLIDDAQYEAKKKQIIDEL